ncbi:MurR/RpiR family transcriptional regulator [Enterococcus devriesei]|uniref:MurR/RpiR family transcriptional regulator n=1 Tax=Enterococcus devriesei TaxID=319970 RepID=UPI001C113475|nr:MurR/RpiR family transcriptional regulator [Enterococcus devriesei]MBU5365603.1 MurR/RpiR family transcriptional regulator [Enterococcus devriesei]MDT2822636.1 MurR/RpiR family transcriptional regulator [Enterococcus devriesei]
MLIEKLTQQDNFSLAEKRIADYILAHLTTIPTIFIQELAEKTFSSHSTIIRLCKKIGCSGFREFKETIAEIVYTQRRDSAAVNVNFPFEPSDTASEIAQKMADLTINTLQKASRQIDANLLDQVADQLLKAERIFLFAQGDTQLRARSFQNKLIKINKFAILAEEYVDTQWNAVNLTDKDCALFISYGGSNPGYEKIMHYLAEKAVPLILLTGNPNSVLVSLATKTLLTIQEEYDFAKIATFSSQTAFEYILNSLFSIMYTRDYEKNIRTLRENQIAMQDGLLADE